MRDVLVERLVRKPASSEPTVGTEAATDDGQVPETCEAYRIMFGF